MADALWAKEGADPCVWVEMDKDVEDVFIGTGNGEPDGSDGSEEEWLVMYPACWPTKLPCKASNSASVKHRSHATRRLLY